MKIWLKMDASPTTSSPSCSVRSSSAARSPACDAQPKEEEGSIICTQRVPARERRGACGRGCSRLHRADTLLGELLPLGRHFLGLEITEHLGQLHHQRHRHLGARVPEAAVTGVRHYREPPHRPRQHHSIEDNLFGVGRAGVGVVGGPATAGRERCRGGRGEGGGFGGASTSCFSFSTSVRTTFSKSLRYFFPVFLSAIG